MDYLLVRVGYLPKVGGNKIDPPTIFPKVESSNGIHKEGTKGPSRINTASSEWNQNCGVVI